MSSIALEVLFFIWKNKGYYTAIKYIYHGYHYYSLAYMCVSYVGPKIYKTVVKPKKEKNKFYYSNNLNEKYNEPYKQFAPVSYEMERVENDEWCCINIF